MNKLVFLIVAFLVMPSFAGCLEAEDKRTIIEEPGIFDFGPGSIINSGTIAAALDKFIVNY